MTLIFLVLAFSFAYLSNDKVAAVKIQPMTPKGPSQLVRFIDHEDPSSLAAAGCMCSPFSGNAGTGECCANGTDVCAHLGQTLHCLPDNPVCCNSDFASNCCPAFSACSQGCRNSLLGSCFCLPPRKSTYNEQDALYSLAFVAASQCDPLAGLNDSWTCVACTPAYKLSEVHVVQNQGHQALVGVGASDRIVVAFRGSLSMQDWIDDFKNVKLVDYPACAGCQVGDGWLDAVQSLQDGVTAAIVNISTHWPNAPIIVTGHSLGAAMAPLFLVELSRTHPDLNAQVVFPLYTFGQPRVGNRAFAQYADLRFPGWYRVVHHDDPVPHLPPREFGFEHMAREVWYAEAGSGPGYYEVCDGSGEDPQCSLGTLLSGEITDHLTYLDHAVCGCKPFLSGVDTESVEMV